MVKEVEKLSYSIETTQTFIYINMGSDMYKLYQELQSPKQLPIAKARVESECFWLDFDDSLVLEKTGVKLVGDKIRNGRVDNRILKLKLIIPITNINRNKIPMQAIPV